MVDQALRQYVHVGHGCCAYWTRRLAISTGEAPTAPVFIDGEKAMTLRGENIADDFVAVIDQYVARRYAGSAP